MSSIGFCRAECDSAIFFHGGPSGLEMALRVWKMPIRRSALPVARLSFISAGWLCAMWWCVGAGCPSLQHSIPPSHHRSLEADVSDGKRRGMDVYDAFQPAGRGYFPCGKLRIPNAGTIFSAEISLRHLPFGFSRRKNGRGNRPARGAVGIGKAADGKWKRVSERVPVPGEFRRWLQGLSCTFEHVWNERQRCTNKPAALERGSGHGRRTCEHSGAC